MTAPRRWRRGDGIEVAPSNGRDANVAAMAFRWGWVAATARPPKGRHAMVPTRAANVAQVQPLEVVGPGQLRDGRALDQSCQLPSSRRHDAAFGPHEAFPRVFQVLERRLACASNR